MSLILVYYSEQSYKRSPQRHLEILCVPRNLEFNLLINFFSFQECDSANISCWVTVPHS